MAKVYKEGSGARLRRCPLFFSCFHTFFAPPTDNFRSLSALSRLPSDLSRPCLIFPAHCADAEKRTVFSPSGRTGAGALGEAAGPGGGRRIRGRTDSAMAVGAVEDPTESLKNGYEGSRMPDPALVRHVAPQGETGKQIREGGCDVRHGQHSFPDLVSTGKAYRKAAEKSTPADQRPFSR